MQWRIALLPLLGVMASLAIMAQPVVAQTDPGDDTGQDVAPTPASASIGGHVFDRSGSAVAGALVQFLDAPDLTTTTDDAGAYTFSVVQPGNHILVAVLGQVATSTASFVTVSADGGFQALDLVVSDIAPSESSGGSDSSGGGGDVPTLTPSPTTPPADNSATDGSTATPTLTPTRASASKATSTPTSTPPPAVTTASISGTVKSDDGSPPSPDTYVMLEDIPAFTAKIDASARYTLSGVPYGKHTMFAQQGQSAGDPISVVVNGDMTQDFSLHPYVGRGGNPTVFVGEVLASDNKSGMSDAEVWRLGGYGFSKSVAGGAFVLADVALDSPGSTRPIRAPDIAIVVASKGNQWGFQRVPTNSSLKDLRIPLDQTGKAPGRPNATEWKPGTTYASNTSALMFVAEWSTFSPSDLGIRTPAPQKDPSSPPDLGANYTDQCQGNCSQQPHPNGLVSVVPPQNHEFQIIVWDEANNQAVANPGWAHAFLVTLGR